MQFVDSLTAAWSMVRKPGEWLNTSLYFEALLWKQTPKNTKTSFGQTNLLFCYSRYDTKFLDI